MLLEETRAVCHGSLLFTENNNLLLPWPEWSQLADLFFGFFLINPLPSADYEPECSELGRFYNLVKLLFKNTYIHFKSFDVSIETGPSRIMHCQVGYGREWVTSIICMWFITTGPATCWASVFMFVCLSLYFQILRY